MRKIETIVREEMDAAGVERDPDADRAPGRALEADRSLGGSTATRSSGSPDRHERELMLGPTHEEVVAPLVAGELPSLQDLPMNLYQVEWKYRDELRPRFGLLRGREFLMKDAYSFDRDEDGMRESYRIMYEAYERIFDRCGLDYVIVEADPGTIGGDVNHEFMALADVGEDLFVRCENGDYLADIGGRDAARRPSPPVDASSTPLTEVDTPGAATIESVAAQLGIDAVADPEDASCSTSDGRERSRCWCPGTAR